MNFKENLLQAAKELMNPESARSTEAAPAQPPVTEPVKIPEPKEEPIAAETQFIEAPAVEKPVVTPAPVPVQPIMGEEIQVSAMSDNRQEPFATPRPAYDASRPSTQGVQRTVLAEGVRIVGTIEAEEGVELYGFLNGNISTKGDLKLCGKLEGDAAGHDVQLLGGKIKGNISAAGNLYIDNEAVVLGDVKARNLSLNGKVKGNLEISETLLMEEEAVIYGNIAAGRTSMKEGSVFQGEMRITSADMGKLFPGMPQPQGQAARSGFTPRREPEAEPRNPFGVKREAEVEPRSAFAVRKENEAEPSRDAFAAMQDPPAADARNAFSATAKQEPQAAAPRAGFGINQPSRNGFSIKRENEPGKPDGTV